MYDWNELDEWVRVVLSNYVSHNCSTSMADLDERIAVLEATIVGYEREYVAEKDPEEKKEIRKLIKTRGDNLTELLRQQTACKFCSSFPFSTYYPF